MTNVPKPDLERGAYIVYTDEPGEILSPGSTGGGGAVFLEADYVEFGSPLVPKFSFNDVKNALDAGQAVFIKWAGQGSETGVFNYFYVFVDELIISDIPDNESYTVTAVNGRNNIFTFYSTDPDELMTDDSF